MGTTAARPEGRVAPVAGNDAGPDTPILVGANPGVQLFDHAGACVAFASCWRVDWSTHGAGSAIVLWQPGTVEVYGSDRRLAEWLTEGFVKHFPELEGLPWSTPHYASTTVEVSISLASGLYARAGNIRVEASQVLDRRMFSTDMAVHDGTRCRLALVIGPCARGVVVVDGRPLAGQVRRSGTPSRPQSSAFVTEAEVWQTGARLP